MHTEWIHDIAQIQISTDGESWQTLWSKSGKYDFWHREYVSLDSFWDNGISQIQAYRSSIHEELTDPVDN